MHIQIHIIPITFTDGCFHKGPTGSFFVGGDLLTGIGHVAATSMVRGHPLLRIAWGFVSHYVTDVFVAEYPSYPPTKKHLPWFLYQGVGIALFCAITGDWWAILYVCFGTYWNGCCGCLNILGASGGNRYFGSTTTKTCYSKGNGALCLR